MIDEMLEKARIFSEELASRYGCQIAAAALYGSRVAGYAKPSSDVDVLLIFEKHPKGILYVYEEFGGLPFSVLTVDRRLFEYDLEKSALGEFVIGRLLTPFIPIAGGDYLRSCSVRFKKKVVLEALLNLESEYPEVYTEFRIKPEYFLLEKLWRRARMYPPVKYSYTRMLSEELRDRNLPLMMEGFMEALKQLEEEGVVRFEDGYVVPVKRLGRRTNKVLSVFKSIERATRAYIVHGYAGRSVSPMKVAWEFASKILRETGSSENMELERPEHYIYLPSELGYSSLFERLSPERVVETLEPFRGFKVVSVEKLGGVLNFVDLLTLRRNGETRRIVVKRFKDWYGFKWFPLSIWTVGVQKFALKGKTRMLREYSAFMRLSRWGLPSPRVLRVDLADKLLFTEYVEGRSFSDVLKRFFSGLEPEDVLESCRLVGKTMAEIHNRGMTLGDPNPNNIRVSDGMVYFLDLEQSSMGGDRSWDLAELLYFTGHMTINHDKAEEFASSILEGYLEVGDPETVKRVAEPKYLRVFTLVTPPNVLLAINRVCKSVPTPRKL